MPAATVIVDASNVVGAGARGWWRDRPGAVRALLDRLQRAAAAVPEERFELVLDVAVKGLADGDHAGVGVLTARRRGRDAADDRIVERLDELVAAATASGAAVDVTVVTSDRALREASTARGAVVVGAGTFLGRLDGLGC